MPAFAFTPHPFYGTFHKQNAYAVRPLTSESLPKHRQKQYSQRINHRCRKNNTVKPVHNAAVPRDHLSVILDPVIAFDRRGCKITHHTDDASDNTDHNEASVQILSINQSNDPSRLYKEVWIGLGGTQSAVYATEVSTQEYLA